MTLEALVALSQNGSDEERREAQERTVSPAAFSCSTGASSYGTRREKLGEHPIPGRFLPTHIGSSRTNWSKKKAFPNWNSGSRPGMLHHMSALQFVGTQDPCLLGDGRCCRGACGLSFATMDAPTLCEARDLEALLRLVPEAEAAVVESHQAWICDCDCNMWCGLLLKRARRKMRWRLAGA